MPRDTILSASFRDPSGFLFRQNGTLYRQVNTVYQNDYEKLINSGLYDKLVQLGYLIPHREVDEPPAKPSLAYRIIQPELVPFISYPYEWSFGQLKDAALTTMAVQKQALSHSMSLKDASAYNIQFYNGRFCLIDTLSFETYQEGKPWTAYRQFCQHFLAPLTLMAYRDIQLGKMLRLYIDGIPLEIARKLLPWRTRFSPGLYMHIHLHASAQKRYANEARQAGKHTARNMTHTSFVGLMDSLESTVKKLHWQAGNTEWADYYNDTNYSDTASEHKEGLIQQFLDKIMPTTVWDLGANTGRYSRLASQKNIFTVAFDIDPSAVEHNYQETVTHKETSMLPLVMDLTNPSTALGWNHQERESLRQRGPADAVLALALIHHLAIANNVPLEQIALFFSQLARWLIIEFVPKSDSQVQRLLAFRKDIFINYTQEGFEEAFMHHFVIKTKEAIKNSERTLYLMEKHND